jgi:hypothetical protein
MYLTLSAWRALTRISPPRKSTGDEDEAALLAAVAALAISALEISIFNLCEFL